MRNVFAAVQYIGNGWSLHFRSLDICHTNVDFAASELLDFYNQVLAAALPAWSRQPPATAHGATLGDVSIHFRSDVPIPWDFIHSYLLAAIGQMRATPGNTVVASYKVALVSVIHTAPIWVELVLPWAGAAAAA
ncbi:MAG: hypothetical protein LQ343_004850 [Gyalolechia ehrenbergii]|nr:MAG: hypothetical protein LQ343_004850 [Gyalolechia ehrenbergii]